MRPFWRLCRAWLVVHTRNMERTTMLTHRDGSLSSAPWSPQPPLQKAALHSGRAQPRGSKSAHGRMANTRGRAQTTTSMVDHLCGSTTGPRALATREGNWIILGSSLFYSGAAGARLGSATDRGCRRRRHRDIATGFLSWDPELSV